MQGRFSNKLLVSTYCLRSIQWEKPYWYNVALAPNPNSNLTNKQNHQSWAFNPWKTLVHRNLISILILIQNSSILGDDNYKKCLFHLEHSKNYNMHFTTQIFYYLYCMQHVITGFHYQIPFQKLRKFLNSEIPYTVWRTYL